MRDGQLSPREEALQAVLASQATATKPGLSDLAWEKLVALAWDNRAHAGDRREIRKVVREIIIEDLHRSGGK